MARLISRDPFAREETWRATYDTCNSGKTCTWCGSVRNDNTLYLYYIKTDSGRTHYIKGMFCSIGCMRAYHGE